MTRSDVKDISDWAYDAYFATREVSAVAQPLMPRRLYGVLEALRECQASSCPQPSTRSLSS